MGVVVAHRAVELGGQLDRGDGLAHAAQAVPRWPSPAQGGGAGGLAVGAGEHRQLGVQVGQLDEAVDDLVEGRQQHAVAAVAQHQRVGDVVDVFRGAAEVDELGDAGDLGLWPRRALSQYSMAFTSWLVVASMAFTASPSATEKLAITGVELGDGGGGERGDLGSWGAAARAFSHSTSTLTRLRIRPNSEKCSRSAETWIRNGVEGDSAVMGCRFMEKALRRKNKVAHFSALAPRFADDKIRPPPTAVQQHEQRSATTRTLHFLEPLAPGPLYLGLIVAQGIYVWLFMAELGHLLMSVFESGGHISETETMLVVLGLIDVVMIANLLIMVIIGGYETFVSRLDLEGHPDQPEWLSHVNAAC